MAVTRNTARNTVRTAVLAAFALLAVFGAIECAQIHQVLIDDHMAMNVVEGWSFVAMTAGCYASIGLIIGASYFLWRGQHRTGALVTLGGVGAFMGLMIILYFYVHATDGWLPFGIEREPLEDAGTAAVMCELKIMAELAAIAVISAIRPKPVGGSRNPEVESIESAV